MDQYDNDGSSNQEVLDATPPGSSGMEGEESVIRKPLTSEEYYDNEEEIDTGEIRRYCVHV